MPLYLPYFSYFLFEKKNIYNVFNSLVCYIEKLLNASGEDFIQAYLLH